MKGISKEWLKERGLVEQPDGSFKKGPVKKEEKTVEGKYQHRLFDHSDSLFIPYNVPSSKNSKQLFKNKKTGNTFITESKLCKEYRKVTKRYYEELGKEFEKTIEDKDPPYLIEFTFVRSSRRRFDFHNILQLVCDLMVDYGWLEDDDMKNLLPIPPLPPQTPYYVDKENPGVYIKVL